MELFITTRLHPTTIKYWVCINCIPTGKSASSYNIPDKLQNILSLMTAMTETLFFKVAVFNVQKRKKRWKVRGQHLLKCTAGYLTHNRWMHDAITVWINTWRCWVKVELSMFSSCVFFWALKLSLTWIERNHKSVRGTNNTEVKWFLTIASDITDSTLGLRH